MFEKAGGPMWTETVTRDGQRFKRFEKIEE